MGRKGLPEGTSVQRNNSEVEARPALVVDEGVFALPHPFKKADSVAHNHRWVYIMGIYMTL